MTYLHYIIKGAYAMKKFEIAIMYNSYTYEDVKTYEYDTIEELQQHLQWIMNSNDDCIYKIELSIQEQDEDGANEDTKTFCEIYPKEYKGE